MSQLHKMKMESDFAGIMPSFAISYIWSVLQVFTPESLGVSFVLLQGFFLSIVLTSEDAMIRTEAYHINNNYISQSTI